MPIVRRSLARLLLCAAALSLALWASGPASAAEPPPGQTPLEVRYHLPEADAVSLVWEAAPPPDVEQAARVVTPMARQGDVFVATVRGPPGATLDYAFRITRVHGAPVEIWDRNGEPGSNYQSVLGENPVVAVRAPQPVEPPGAGPRIANSDLLLVALVVALLAAASPLERWWARARDDPPMPAGTPARRLSGLGASRIGLGLLCALLVAHTLAFGGYIADDAAISLAFARSLAAGHGFVLYPGGERVEAFSNFLLVLVQASVYLAGLGWIGPVAILKGIGLAFGLASLALLVHLPTVAYGHREPPLPRLFGGLYLAPSTSFAHWTGAGLENPLYSFVILLAVWLYLRELRDPDAWPLSALALFLVAITRPEGVLCFGTLLAHRTVVMAAERRRPSRNDLLWLAGFALPLLAFLLWRYSYFGYWVPNTFYAKMDHRSLALLPAYLADFGDAGWRYIRSFVVQSHLAIFLPLLLLALADRRHWRANLLVAGLIGANLLYVVYVGGDWWQSFRFLTPLIPLLGLLIAHGAQRALDLASPRSPAPYLALGLLALAAFVFNARTTAELLRRDDDRLVGMQSRIERGLRFRSFADALGLRDASYLEPDIGGTSLVSGLRIVDLARLADIHLARYQYEPATFRQYIFEERRPDFVHTHGNWTRDSGLTAFPEFWVDYVPISAYVDRFGINGDFVRKDLFVVDAVPASARWSEAAFGELVLLGFRLEQPATAPGQRVAFTWYWRCTPLCGRDEQLSLALRDEQGREVAAWRGPPVSGWYPTGHWLRGEIVRDTRALELPAAMPPGVYRLVAGAGAEHRGVVVGELVVDGERAVTLAGERATAAEEHARRGDWERAAEELRVAARLAPELPEYGAALERAEAELRRWLLARAREELGAGRLDEAERLIRRAREVGTPVNGSEEGRLLGDVLFDRGEAAYARRDYREAYRAFLLALEADPANVWARHRLEDSRALLATP
jgi:hypothetical protein